MSKRYGYKGRISNQRIGDGITVSNGMIIVQDGHEQEFQAIPWARQGLADGTIKFLGSEREPEAVTHAPEPTGLSLNAASKIAKDEFGLSKADLRRLLDDGAVPGKMETGEYSIPEDAMRDALRRLQESQTEPEPEG